MQSNDGSLIGQAGVKYGLQKPAAIPSKARPLSVFGADSDEEEDVGAQVIRQADKKRAAAKVQAQYEAALAQDASVFDYDGVYDSLQQQKVQPKQQEKIARQSRYIAQLKDQAEKRKKEDDIAFERKQLKDRLKEDHLFEGKEVFVTGAYKRKLEEQKKWLEDEKRKEEEDAKHDVRKVGHMHNFYANLLNKNVAFGTADAKTDALSGEGPPPEASDRQEPSGAAPPGGAAPVDKEKQQAQLVAAAAKAGVNLDKYDLLRMEAERALGARGGAGGTSSAAVVGPAADSAVAEVSPSALDDGKDRGRAENSGAVLGHAVAAPSSAEAESEAAAAAALPALKRRNDDSSVQSARERYLARKKLNS